jgi:membrane protein required for colicin V production
MSVVDYALIVIVAVSIFIGFMRGFVREAISLVTWGLAIWVALRYAWVLDPWLGALADSPAIRLWAARGILFIVVLVAGAVISIVMGMLVRGTGLTGTDRLLGMVFGLGRGALVIGILVIAGQYAGMAGDPWWQQSRLMPYGERLADALRGLADEAVVTWDQIITPAPAADGRTTALR